MQDEMPIKLEVNCKKNIYSNNDTFPVRLFLKAEGRLFPPVGVVSFTQLSVV